MEQVKAVIASLKPVHWVIVAVAFLGGCTILGIVGGLSDPAAVSESEEVSERVKNKVASAEPSFEGFESVKDWQKVWCGGGSGAENYAHKRVEALGMERRGILGGVETGWLDRVAKEDGRITRSDFPLAYVVVAESYRKNVAGERDKVRFAFRFSFTCTELSAAHSTITR